MSFRLDPSEFNKVISRRQYAEHYEPEGCRLDTLQQLVSRPGFPIVLPDSPLVYMYEYSEPRPGGGLQVTLYTTQSRDHVVLVQFSD